MAEVICMPKLGFNMDEGQLVRWCKAVGEEVKKGEVLFEINTDKTTMPVEATGDGVLLKTMLRENEYADVFTPIAVVGAAGEDADAALAAYGDGAEGGSAPAAPAEEENAGTYCNGHSGTCCNSHRSSSDSGCQRSETDTEGKETGKR